MHFWEHPQFIYGHYQFTYIQLVLSPAYEQHSIIIAKIQIIHVNKLSEYGSDDSKVCWIQNIHIKVPINSDCNVLPIL